MKTNALGLIPAITMFLLPLPDPPLFAEDSENGTGPNNRDEKGRNAVYYAKDLETLEYLAASGFRFDIVDNEGVSPLMSAFTGFTREETINFILDWEAEHSPAFCGGFDTRKEYYTALLARFLPVWSWRGEDKTAVVKKLLNGGADPAARDSGGIPIIFLAGWSDLSDVIPLLVERGAPVNEYDAKGQTLLSLAIEHRKNESIDFLLLHGADPNLANSAGETPLMMASREAITETLLRHGADPNLRDTDGKTALMYPRDYDSINTLLQSGADPAAKDNEGKTVLHHRSHMLDGALIDKIVSAAISIDEPDCNGTTPLMEAIEHFSINEKVIVALLEKGANPNIRDSKGRNALHLSMLYLEKETLYYAWGGNQDDCKMVIAALLAAGARPADRDNEGDSALTAIFRIFGMDSETRPLRDMIVKHASTAEIKAAKAAARPEVLKGKVKKLQGTLSYHSKIVAAVIVVLIYVGLCIGMREGVFAADKSANPMGRINLILTMSAAGLVIGFCAFIPVAEASMNGSWADMFSGLIAVLGGLIGGAVGIVVGSILAAAVPKIPRALDVYPLLYYFSVLLNAAGIGIVTHFFWVE